MNHLILKKANGYYFNNIQNIVLNTHYKILYFITDYNLSNIMNPNNKMLKINFGLAIRSFTFNFN